MLQVTIRSAAKMAIPNIVDTHVLALSVPLRELESRLGDSRSILRVQCRHRDSNGSLARGKKISTDTMVTSTTSSTMDTTPDLLCIYRHSLSEDAFNFVCLHVCTLKKHNTLESLSDCIIQELALP